MLDLSPTQLQNSIFWYGPDHHFKCLEACLLVAVEDSATDCVF